MRCVTFSGIRQYNYYAKLATFLYGIYEGIERYMLRCLCYHCKNRAIGCHKFCSDYRKYRQELEEMQAQKKKDKEEYRATMSTLIKGNVKRK